MSIKVWQVLLAVVAAVILGFLFLGKKGSTKVTTATSLVPTTTTAPPASMAPLDPTPTTARRAATTTTAHPSSSPRPVSASSPAAKPAAGAPAAAPTTAAPARAAAIVTTTTTRPATTTTAPAAPQCYPTLFAVPRRPGTYVSGRIAWSGISGRFNAALLDEGGATVASRWLGNAAESSAAINLRIPASAMPGSTMTVTGYVEPGSPLCSIAFTVDAP